MENLMQEMLRVLAGRGVESERALQALRALSSWFGGQLVYIPQQKRTQSRIGQEIYGVLADAVGDADAQRIYDIIARFYGGVQWYIPVEKTAFRKQIAQEIAQEYNGSVDSMRDLCRKYGMSFNQMYRLYHEGQDALRQNEFNFDCSYEKKQG